MHRINEETYKNPDFKNDEQRQSSNGEFSAVEVKASYSHPLPGKGQTHWYFIPFTLTYVNGLHVFTLVLVDFTNPQGPQQLHMQNRYKEELKQQVGTRLLLHCIYYKYIQGNITLWKYMGRELLSYLCDLGLREKNRVWSTPTHRENMQTPYILAVRQAY